LTASGNRIVDQHGNPIVLRGMSLYWSQPWDNQPLSGGGKFYNEDCIEWLVEDWHCMVVRAAMGIEPEYGYLSNPEVEKAKIKTVIDACIAQGIYVIVDWHEENAQNHQDQAIDFFEEIADEYGEYPNLIYEIFNEPTQVSWADVVKPYSNAVVDAIRAIDEDNLIVVGTPTWSQDVDVVSRDPLEQNNIAYTLHFYAASHKQSLRNKALTALNNGVALFVTEFGTVEYTGNGPVDSAETRTWMNFMEYHQVSWCNWSLSDINESSAALKVGASATGGWSEDQISESGSLIRNYIINGNTGQINDIAHNRRMPGEFSLNQNYPNPFNMSTRLSFVVSQAAEVRLRIYDLNGQLVRTVQHDHLPAGRYSYIWNADTDVGTKVGCGVYLIRLEASSNGVIATDSKKMVLLK
jgi:endoglucanase